MSLIIDAASWMLILAGGFFCVVGAFGTLRFPDLYTRMHAAGVLDPFGVSLILAGLMLQAGLKKDDFKSLFAVNPPNAILALHRRQADAAGAGDVVLDLPLVKNAVNTDELTKLAVSAPLLHLPVAVKRKMPAKLRLDIQSILLNLNNNEAGKQVLKSAVLTGIGKAEDKDYEPHRKIVRAALGPLDQVKP